LEFIHIGNTSVRALHRLSSYDETGVSGVDESALGAGVKYQAGVFHSIDLKAMQHHLSRANDETSGALTWEANWSDVLRSRAMAEKTPIYTARALNNSITERSLETAAEFDVAPLWLLRGRVRAAELSDGNQRATYVFSVARYMWKRLGPHVDYRLTLDNMDDLSPDYYSPRHLHEQQLGVTWPYRWKDYYFSASYLPGFGKESNSRTQAIHDLSADVKRTWGRFMLSLAGGIGKTPTYRSSRATLSAQYQF
jgi:hypothetical protein